MRFLATTSFSTNGAFNSEKDDKELDRLLTSLQSGGAEIRNITVRLAGHSTGATSLYVVEYEAPAPIDVTR